MTYPPSCHRFGPHFERVPVFEEDPDRAVVFGISYPKREVKQNLVSGLTKVQSGSFSIGLLHANVGNNPDHDPYAPCSLEDLVETGVDYWALGHIHARQVLRQGEPAVVYPGNPQGKNPTESGPKGVYLVEVNDSANVSLDFRSMDTVRWSRPCLDISSMETEQDLLESSSDLMGESLSAAEGRSVVARITLIGRGVISHSLRRPGFMEEVREDVNQEWQGQSPFVWCERIDNETASPFNREERLAGSDFVAEFLQICNRATTDQYLRDQIREGLTELYEHRTFRQHLPNSIPKDEELSALIEKAESIAMNLLIADEET